jgi:hypothetical protein
LLDTKTALKRQLDSLIVTKRPVDVPKDRRQIFRYVHMDK